MSFNIVDYCLKKYKEEKKELEYLLSRELRIKESESFEFCARIKVSEKDIENMELKDQYQDWAILELTGNIINSETNKMIFKNLKMIFHVNVNENAPDNERFYFLGF